MTRLHDKLDDADWLRARRAEGWSVKTLAAALHVHHRRVSAALRRAGLEVPLPTTHVPELHDVEWLRTTLREHSMADVARMLGCTRQSVRYAVRKFGLSAIDGHKPPPEVDATLADREWLARRRAAGATVGELAAELGTSADRVGAAVRAARLPPLRRNGSHPTFPKLYDVEWVRAELAGRTRTELARDLGCSLRSVKDAARRAGLAPTRRSHDDS
jgi:DNA-directed RNA polymerase specialized sigma24 family protein